MGNFSDWYNWDLHIHTPETELNDNFQDENGHRENKEDVWKRYCKEINGYNADVLGITDYFSVNNYFKLKENRKKWGLRDDIVLMPNMELRVNDITSKKRAKGSGDSSFVNLHIIFDPNIDREYLDKFLRKLTVTDIDDKEINFKEDRDKIFINQEIKYLISTKDVIKALENVFGKNFSDKCLIMLPNTQDGIVLESGNGSQNGINFAKRYVSLLQARTNKAQENIEYLRKKDNSYGKIFSVVTGSDAHRLDDLENFSNRSRTWIKADKTFNGLKQIIFEPELRVKIQEEKPSNKMNSQVIKSIELNNEEFKKQTLYFSEYLNTIIGGRSSGKSILLSIIANLCRSVEEFKTDNKEYDQLVKDLSEGSIVTFAYGNIADGNSNIKFIFQDGLQKIARNKNDFNKFINQNFISKTDLKNLLVSIENKKQDIQNELLNKIRDIQLLDKKIIGFKSELSENQNISVIQENINQLENEINKAQENVSKLDKDKVTNLLSEEQNTHNVQKNIELGKQTLDVIINSDVVSISSNINGINNIYIQDIVEEINAYVANINAHISEVANEKKEKLEVLETENIKKISDIHSDNDYVEYFKVQQNFPEIRDKQTMLENQEKLYDHLEKILKAFDNEKIEKKSRIDEIINLFNVQDLKKQVVIYNEDELVVKYISDLKIEPLIDLCRDSFKTSTNVFRSLLPDLILSKFSEDKINADDDLKIEDLVTFVRNCLTKDISSALRSGKTLYDVLNKLASLDFITESYSVKYNNQFFNQMSEGKKSFVLLLMQLTISEDNSPLLIDQPEDELDNKAIYNELVRFIRNQKIRRQLFIVTHNPNVVVAGDSESITIAEQKIRSNGEYEFIYTQGTIEDSETQEKICLVLEGGKTAFLNRQKRYEFITEVRS